MLLAGPTASAQETTLTARVALVNNAKKNKARDASNVVMWLTPSDGAVVASAPVPQSFPLPRLVQRNKGFEPHVLVVRVGSLVEFPNRDPFFHNVFSLFDGKRFDLGLYEAGTTRNVLFDKPGISYIFCNIHPEMSAVVVALNTPYYGISDRQGQIIIPAVTPGHYTLRVWYEATLPERLNGMAREVTVSESTSTLGVFQLPTSTMPEEHKNMYGRDYPPPSPDSPAYVHP
jgi:plastocyanin